MSYLKPLASTLYCCFKLNFVQLIRDLEGLIAKGAFSEDGGLHHANVIEKSLVDHFVPFLPIERRHVKQCILVETEKHLGKYKLNEEV